MLSCQIVQPKFGNRIKHNYTAKYFSTGDLPSSARRTDTAGIVGLWGHAVFLLLQTINSHVHCHMQLEREVTTPFNCELKKKVWQFSVENGGEAWPRRAAETLLSRETTIAAPCRALKNIKRKLSSSPQWWRLVKYKQKRGFTVLYWEVGRGAGGGGKGGPLVSECVTWKQKHRDTGYRFGQVQI